VVVLHKLEVQDFLVVMVVQALLLLDTEQTKGKI
jgi:hypothetical protein